MIVFRVLQIVILLLTVFFIGMAVYYIISGEKTGSIPMYFSLGGAGILISVLLHFAVRALKKHL